MKSKHDHTADFEETARILARHKLAYGQFFRLLEQRGISKELIQIVYDEAWSDVHFFLSRGGPESCLLCEPGYVLIELAEAKHEQT